MGRTPHRVGSQDDASFLEPGAVATCLQIKFDAAHARVDLGKKGVDFMVAIPRFQLNPNPLINKAVADGVFVHFTIRDPVLLHSVLDQVFTMAKPSDGQPHGRYGSNKSGEGKKIHLRNTIIGAFLLVSETSLWFLLPTIHYLKRLSCSLGDWGAQFGLLAVGFKRYRSEAALAENATMHVFNVYVKISAYKEADTASGDPKALALWTPFHDLFIDTYKRVYSRLNVEFDDYIGESLVTNENIDSVMRDLRNKGFLAEKHMWESQHGRDYKLPPPTDEEGKPLRDENPAWAVDLHRFKLDKPVVQKPVYKYTVRDIAGAIQRFERYNFNKMIYVVEDQQDLHYAQLFKILDLLGAPFADRLEHINFGKVKGMSTRKGDVKTFMMGKLNNVEDPEATSDQIQDMQAKRINSYTFDIMRTTSFEGDTGAYLQYTHSRLCSVERKVALEISLSKDSADVDTDLLVEPKARDMAYVLGCYPEVARMAFEVSEPSTIVSHCFKLSHVISSASETLIDERIAGARLLLFVCARLVLASGMRLLSLNPLKRM
ncbi:arginyl-tRNA synthetase [Mycena crocata]|nr:arginyl-tRNA synthetase [Mycena crocata]